MSALDRQIAKLRELRQALLDAGMAATEADAKIALLAKKSFETQAFGKGTRTAGGTAELNQASVERGTKRIISAAQGEADLKRIETLGNNFRVTLNKVVTDVIKGLESDINTAKVVAARGGTTLEEESLLPGAIKSKRTLKNRIAEKQAESGTGYPQTPERLLEDIKRVEDEWVKAGGKREEFKRIVDAATQGEINDLKKLEDALKIAKNAYGELIQTGKVASAGLGGVGGTPAATPGGIDKLQDMRNYLEILKKDMVSLTGSTEEFDRIFNKIVGNDVNNLEKLEKAAAKARDRFAELSAMRGGQTTPPVTPQTPPTQPPLNRVPLPTKEEKPDITDFKTTEKFDLVYPSITQKIDKRIAEEAKASLRSINSELFKSGEVVTNVDLKMKNLSNGVKQMSATFRNGNTVLQQETLYFKEVNGAMKQVSESTDKVTKAQKEYYDQASKMGSQNYNRQFSGLRTKMEESGYSFENLKSVYKESTTGISSFKFEKFNEGIQAVEKLNVTLDRNGVVLNDTQKRFRSFGDAIVRDIGEVLKWSIAVGLVYGSMQKLQQLMSDAIANQTKLVEITIAMGNAQRSVNDIFTDAARIAQATGESIGGVLEGYVQAYRASGDISDPIERATAANKFLSDSLVLSKLSALDQAEAMDILSGALKQMAGNTGDTNVALAKSTDLLDSWVATTKAANVDMATLATAFSITEESASNAGLSMTELNAVIAVMSEKIGALGPKETGNTVRALVGGIYSENAQQQLAKFGVTVQDATGKSRGFLEIMTQIYQLNKAGIINDDQLNKLALALGGGVRRGQQYLAFITSLNRVYEVNAAQANRAGMSEEAMGKILETVQTSATKLGNSFQGLAQALGGEGGFLTAAKTILDILTKIVDIMTTLTQVAGKAGPALLATFAAASYFGQGNRVGGISRGLGNVIAGIPFLGQAATNRYSPTPQTSPQTNLSPFLVGGMGAAKVGAGTADVSYYSQIAAANMMPVLTKLAGAIGPLISAGLNASQGEFSRAGGNIAGAFLGGLATGFNPIGMAVGSVIGESFAGTVDRWLNTKEKDVAAALPKTPQEQQKEQVQKTEEELYNERKKARENAIFDEIYGIIGQEYQKQINQGIANIQVGGYGGAPAVSPGKVMEAGPSPELGKFLAGMMAPFLDKSKYVPGYEQQGAALQLAQKLELPEEAMRKVEELIKALEESKKATLKTADTIDKSASIATQESINTKFQDFFNQYATETQAKTLQQLMRGDISAKEQRGAISALPGLPAATEQIYTALGGTATSTSQLMESITGIAGQEENIRRLMDLLITAPDEASQYIKQLASDINSLNDALTSQEPLVYGGEVLDTAEKKTAALTARTKELESALKGMFIEMARTKIQVPDVQMFEDLSSKQFKDVEARARQIQQTEYKNILPDLSQQELDDFFSGFEPYFAKTKENYQKIFKLDPKYLQQAFAELEKAGKIASKSINFGFFDAEKYRLAEQYYSRTAANLGKLGYVEDNTPQIVALSDGTIQKTTKDSKIMSLLMSQLVDLSEKQLDGIYNLPTNASFYVPSQAAGMAGRGGGGGIDVSGLEKLANANVIGAETPAQPTTNALGQATTANYSKFLEEEQKRIEAEAQVAMAKLQTQTTKPANQYEKETGFLKNALESAAKEASSRNKVLPDTLQKQQQVGGTEETGFLRNMIEALGNVKVNSQLELKQNITATVNVVLNQAQVGRAVAKYLEEQQLIFSQNSITKNTVIGG